MRDSIYIVILNISYHMHQNIICAKPSSCKILVQKFPYPRQFFTQLCPFSAIYSCPLFEN